MLSEKCWTHWTGFLIILKFVVGAPVAAKWGVVLPRHAQYCCVRYFFGTTFDVRERVLKIGGSNSRISTSSDAAAGLDCVPIC